MSTLFERPKGKPAFTAPWVLWFASRLTLPEGTPYRFEGHTLLMTREFFARELVHLLVVIPKNNQKTTWEAALAVWHMLSVPAPRAYCGAADKEQATELYNFAKAFIEAEPELEAKLDVRPSTKEIRVRGSTADVFKVLASDDSRQGGKKQGKNTTLWELDELHAHENDSLLIDARSSGFKRRDAALVAGYELWWTLGKMASITTAGFDKEGALGRELVKFLGDPKMGVPPKGTVERDLRVLSDGSVVHDPDVGRLTIARFGEGRNVLLMWASREDDDPDDFEVVKLANPASTVTVQSLKDARESLAPWAYERYRMNRWTLAFESWIPVGSWDAMEDTSVPRVVHRTWEDATIVDRPYEDDEERELTPEFQAFIDSLYPLGTYAVGALDMARYRDTAALTMVARRPDGKKVPRAIVWRSGGPEHPIRYEWVEAAAKALDRRYVLGAFGADPKYADQLLERLANAGLKTESFPQSPERMGKADTDLSQEIRDGEFAHDGDPILTSHIYAGKGKDVGPNLIVVVRQKRPNPPPIDACKALSMANALEKVATPDVSAEWW